MPLVERRIEELIGLLGSDGAPTSYGLKRICGLDGSIGAMSVSYSSCKVSAVRFLPSLTKSRSGDGTMVWDKGEGRRAEALKAAATEAAADRPGESDAPLGVDSFDLLCSLVLSSSSRSTTSRSGTSVLRFLPAIWSFVGSSKLNSGLNGTRGLVYRRRGDMPGPKYVTLRAEPMPERGGKGALPIENTDPGDETEPPATDRRGVMLGSSRCEA